MRLAGILIFLAHVAMGQPTVHAYDDERFVLRVKQIDEFIERFNNTDQTSLKEYLRANYQQEITREELVLSLFDKDSAPDEETVRRFIGDVTNHHRPPYLSFYDRDWYAKVVCRADYQGQPTSFDLVMAVTTNQADNSVNWAIRSVRAEFIDVLGGVNFNTLLPPNGHGTNFLELRRIFSNPTQYADPAQPSQNAMNQLLQLAQQGTLVFGGVQEVTYHFLQLNRWIMKVKEFDRTVASHGWLISQLISATTEEKEAYLQDQLYLSPEEIHAYERTSN